MSEKILILYLSRTNNTKTVAELIHRRIGGDLVVLELENPYPKNYRAIVDQVAEENRTGYLPPLKTQVDIDKYDTIFIGFPTWGMQLPPPMKSFLNHQDIKGKTIAPFNTNGGYGLGSTVKTIRKLCPESEVLKVFSVRGGSERDGVYLAIKGDRKVKVEELLESWLDEIQISK
nr:flavodoxin [uncultured Allomuricauda sp.]